MIDILIPKFEVNGTDSYPDDINLFNNVEEVSIENKQYFLCKYSGAKQLETGVHTYADYVAQQQQKDLLPFALHLIRAEREPKGGERIALEVTQPNDVISLNTGDTSHFRVELKDRFGKHLPYNGSFDLPVAGELGSSPFIIKVNFHNGFSDITVNDWASGRWRVSEDVINLDLGPDEAKFTFAGLTIKVREQQ